MRRTKLIARICSPHRGRYLKFDVGALARDARVSETLVRRFLDGDTVGPEAALRLERLLGLTAEASRPRGQ